jgi:hypothetical protein
MLMSAHFSWMVQRPFLGTKMQKIPYFWGKQGNMSPVLDDEFLIFVMNNHLISKQKNYQENNQLSQIILQLIWA